MRTDLYGLVHKAQRYHLFAFAQELSRSDLGDAATQAHLTSGVRRIHELLVEHANNEARYIHPLYAAVGNGAEPLDVEHRALEAELDAWLAIVEQNRWPELYRCTMRVIANYLLHIDAEERAQREILWASYGDTDLAAVLTRFRAERAPAAAFADFELMLPAFNVAELSGVLRNIRAAAPEAVWQQVLARAQSVLGPERWADVEKLLGT